MRVAVFGLGYVGSVTASCLAKLGHTVIGVEPVAAKRELFAAGVCPIIEPELGPLLAMQVQEGRISVTASAAEAVAKSEVALLCVPTPSDASGGMDPQYLRTAVNDIATALERSTIMQYTVVVRSTVEPGTLEGLVIPRLREAMARRPGAHFGAAMNPEFLREGTAVADFVSPFATVIGASDAESSAVCSALYEALDVPVVDMAPREAEFVKYASNSFHALKVAFANEIGALASAHSVDGGKIMALFARDTKLNVSAKYLRPGFAFGGSCLPKDIRALTALGRRDGLSLPLLESLLPSNQSHLARGIALVEQTGGRRILMLGLSFKWQTDDLRESPSVDLAEALVASGLELQIHDPSVLLSRERSAAADVRVRLPHLNQLLCENLTEAMRWADVVVLTGHHPMHLSAMQAIRDDQWLVDLCGATSGRAFHGQLLALTGPNSPAHAAVL